MATLYVSVNDVTYVRTSGENYSVVIGWVSIADIVDATDIVDILVGSTRALLVYDTIQLEDNCTIPTPTVTAKLYNVSRAIWSIDAIGVRIAEADEFLYIPVRLTEISGGILLESNLPTRSLDAEVSFAWGASLSRNIPVRTVEILSGAEQVIGKLPTREIEAIAYEAWGSVVTYIPVRTITTATSYAVYITFSGVITVRAIQASVYSGNTASLDKKRPIYTGEISVLQDYGVTLDRLIPVRKIDTDEYEADISLTGYIPVWIIGASVSGGGTVGEGSLVTPTVLEDYVLKYTRP